jgi:hypothetical protein
MSKGDCGALAETTYLMRNAPAADIEIRVVFSGRLERPFNNSATIQTAGSVPCWASRTRNEELRPCKS